MPDPHDDPGVEQATLKSMIAAALVLLGALQAALGLADGAVAQAGVGVGLSLVGVLYYWAEVHRLDA